VSAAVRRCRTCCELLPGVAFEVGRAICRDCRADQKRHHYQANRERILERQRSTPRSRDVESEWLRYRYGITPDDRDQMLAAQRFRCAVGHATGQPLEVDHDHVTGAVRGLLCGACNRGIGLLRDDPDRCVAAARYLRSWSERT
jgi:hypothetical protein